MDKLLKLFDYFDNLYYNYDFITDIKTKKYYFDIFVDNYMTNEIKYSAKLKEKKIIRKDNSLCFRIVLIETASKPNINYYDDKIIILRLYNNKNKKYIINVPIHENLFSEKLYNKIIKIKDYTKNKLYKELQKLKKQIQIENIKNNINKDFI